jgi:hypothetical protein
MEGSSGSGKRGEGDLDEAVEVEGFDNGGRRDPTMVGLDDGDAPC